MNRLLTPVVKNLLILNGLMFLATFIVQDRFHFDLTDYLGLHYYKSPLFKPYQFISHIFMHGNLGHIFSNMFALWMFGTALERIWGGKKFLLYYLVTALGAGILHMGVTTYEMIELQKDADVVINSPTHDHFLDFLGKHASARDIRNSNPNNMEIPEVNFVTEYVDLKRDVATVGASGAVFGLLLAFGVLFPNTELIMLFFPVPIKAKYFVALYGLFELFQGLQNNPTDNVAHFAHLGGMLFGFILLFIWRRNRYNHEI